MRDGTVTKAGEDNQMRKSASSVLFARFRHQPTAHHKTDVAISRPLHLLIVPRLYHEAQLSLTPSILGNLGKIANNLKTSPPFRLLSIIISIKI